MNIDDLTLGQIKEIQQSNNQSKSSLTDRYIGRYVIVRTINEGINAGVVVAANETGIILKDVRRLWSNRPLDPLLSWYEGVAVSGLHANNKIAGVVEEKAIMEDYSITLCTNVAEESIREFKTNAQS